MSPEALVQRQLDAYNRRDLAGFLETYHPDATIFRMPSPDPVLRGREQIGRHYAAYRFNLPGLRAELRARTILGNKVFDHERVWGMGPEPTEVVAVYEVVEDLIAHVWFFSPE